MIQAGKMRGGDLTSYSLQENNTPYALVGSVCLAQKCLIHFVFNLTKINLTNVTIVEAQVYA